MTGHDLGFIHPQAGTDNPIVLTDRHTGEVIVSYDEGIRYPREIPRDLRGKDHPELGLGGRFNKNTTEGQLLVYENTLIQFYAKDVKALDVATGKLLWAVKNTTPSPSRGCEPRWETIIYPRSHDSHERIWPLGIL